MRLRNTVIAMLAGLSLAVVFAQEVRRDGKWEITQQMSMPGMQMPATTITQCITKEDLADPQKQMQQPPQRGAAQSDCKVYDYKVDGNKVSMKMTCTTPQAMVATTEMTYGVDKYDGTMKMEMNRGGQQMTMNMKMTGKRLGDCTK